MRWRPLRVRAPSWDAGLVVLVAGFLLVVPIRAAAGGATASVLGWISDLAAGDPFADYKEAVAEAAIKRPEYKRELETIKTLTPTVVNFGEPLAASKSLERPLWVALESELRKQCAGAENPVLKLQQILGLPRTHAPNSVVNVFTVERDVLFRPCASNSDVTAATCEFAFQDPLPPAASGMPDPPTTYEGLLGRYNELRDAHTRLYFFAKQTWQSYQIGFPRSDAAPFDYPDSGYPFTGMGWSYDWSASSRDHFGVSEFVVKPGTEIEGVVPKTPTEFCAGNSTPEQPTEAPEQPTETPEQPTETPQQPTEAPQQPTETPEQPTEAPEQPTE